MNVTTANMNLTLIAVYVCRVNSSCANQETIGSATGLSVSLSTTGVKTVNVDGSAVTLAAGDMVNIVWVVSNGSMNTQGIGVTPDQNIDSPFTQITPSLLWDPLRPMRPHLVRKVREFFLGGLPPKLAKLRMIQNNAGLFVPASETQLLKAA